MAAAAASFLGMWLLMMVAMMLPSLVPMLWRYRPAVARTTMKYQRRSPRLVRERSAAASGMMRR